MAKALYRKYRPLDLASVRGQDQVTKVLSEALKQGKLSHAYLFVGPRGTGKTSVARIFAHEINQFNYQLEDDYVDIIEIDGASNRSIDDIRELREKVTIAPTEGKYKVYIIDEVHMLTREAFNALLKTLEEPPEHVIFVMATTDVHKVPTTIISRAQTYTFQLAESAEMQKFLREVADKEKINITDEALEIIAKRGGGSYRDSLSLLDQISNLSKQEITGELVASALGLAEDKLLDKLLLAYTAGDLQEIVQFLQEILASGTRPEGLAENLISRIIAKPKPELLGLLARLTNVAAPFPEAKLLVALTEELKATPKISSRQPKARDEEPHKTARTSAPPVINQPTDDLSNDDTAEPSLQAAFSWVEFLNKFQSLSDTVYTQLQRVEHAVIGRTLHIYPKTAATKTILSSKHNRELLVSEAAGLKIAIHDTSEQPAKPENLAKNNHKTDQLSAIMGGEVKEYGGENPFTA